MTEALVGATLLVFFLYVVKKERDYGKLDD